MVASFSEQVGWEKPRAKAAVQILVCGNAGPVGGDLLRRRDIAVHWALSTAEALAVLKRARPLVCLIRESFAEAILQQRPQNVPTSFVVLMDDANWSRSAALFEAGATALVHAGTPERILEAISELTGLAFAQYPRVAYRAPVEVSGEGLEARLLQTVNISASGVCVRGLEPLRIGSGVCASFPLLDPPLETSAIVVRCFSQDDEPMAALCFNALKAVDRVRLIALVNQQLEESQDNAVTIDVPDLADEIEVGVGSIANGEAAIAELKLKLRQVHEESKRDSSLGELRKNGLVRLERQLTASERAAMLGRPAPVWAGPALDAHLELHLDRRERGRPSAEAVERTLGLCRGMGAAISDDDYSALCEVTLTRAALLREVYSEAGSSRRGSIAPPPGARPSSPKKKRSRK